MRYIFAGLSCVALTACAADVVRLEYAGQVSTQAGALVVAARTYTKDVEARRRDANIALVASDPSCNWGDTLIIDDQWRPPAGLCDLKHVPKTRWTTLDLRTVSPKALETITTAIAGVASYQQALAAVLDDKPPDAKEAIDGAIETLTTATTDINRIAGEKLFDLGPLTSDRAKAVVGLVSTLIALQQTNLKVKRVRAVVADQDSEPLLAALEQSVGRLAGLQDANSAARAQFALNTAYLSERSKASFAERREWIRKLADASDEGDAVRKVRIAALMNAIAKLRSTDETLRKALAGQFSKADRQRIARENRTQIAGILSQVAALFPAL
jgi:formate dehydrogenase maturation protein FdhE